MKPEGYVHGMTDKPAATVHGTGSGDKLNYGGEAPTIENGGLGEGLSTPPASPTVTLVYDGPSLPMLGIEHEIYRVQVLRGGKWETLETEQQYDELLVLLRAAEQKQPTNGTEAVLTQAKKESALLYEELTKLKAQVKDLLNHLSSSGT